MSNKMGKRRRLRTIMAYHEAGHAVAARALGIDVEFVSMRPLDSDTAAVVPTRSALWLSRGASTEAQICAAEADAMVALAGPTAEKHSPVPHQEVEHEEDISNAVSAVGRAAALAAGMSIPEQVDGAVELTGDVAADARARFDRVKIATARLLSDNWSAVERVARTLERRDRIDQGELDRLIAGVA
jgi:hypothetical protein